MTSPTMIAMFQKTGVSAGTTQWWVVTKVGGGCGLYTITITPT